jgi:hemerythrin-like domain-containing protein
MKDELRLLRQAHEQQAKRLVAERVVAADRIRELEVRAERLEREAADAREDARLHVEAANEETRRHIEAARRERDAALRQLEEFRATRTYRVLTRVNQLLSRGPGRSR